LLLLPLHLLLPLKQQRLLRGRMAEEGLLLTLLREIPRRR